MKLFPYLVAVAIIFCGCAEKKSPSGAKPHFVPVKDMVYNVGFISNHKHSDTYYHLADSTEYLYFGNVVTNRAINILSPDGAIKWHIQLDSVLKQAGNIDNFGIIDPDTIIVLSQYTNMLYWINSKGECYNQIWIDSAVKNDRGDYFEYTSSLYQSPVVDRHTIFLSADWLQHDNYDMAPVGHQDYLKSYFKGVRKAAQLLRIDLKGTAIKGFKFGAYGYYDGLDTNYMISDPPYIASANNRFFKTSIDNRICEVDRESMEITGWHTVKSDHTKIGTEAYAFSKGGGGVTGGFGDWVEHTMRISGRINRVIYDPFRKLYYVVVYHQVPKDTPKEKNGAIRDWSLIFYDTDFNKLNEQTFKGDKFSGGNLIVTKQGVLVSTNFSTNKDYDPAKSHFKLFKVQK